MIKYIQEGGLMLAYFSGVTRILFKTLMLKHNELFAKTKGLPVLLA